MVYYNYTHEPYVFVGAHVHLHMYTLICLWILTWYIMYMVYYKYTHELHVCVGVHMHIHIYIHVHTYVYEYVYSINGGEDS